MKPLGYSGSTPEPVHCPEAGCEECGPECPEKEEHQLCGWHSEEARQAAAEIAFERHREEGF